MSSGDTLERIAQILDVPIATFSDEAAGSRADEAIEAQRLLDAIQSPDDRRMVLRFLRGVAERQRPT